DTFNQVLSAQRRFSAANIINTPITMTNIGWILFQQKRYAEAETSLREATGNMHRIAPDAWERFNADALLGAALAAQKKFVEAEPLLVSGYAGMGTAKHQVAITTSSAFDQKQAAQTLVQLYTDWQKPDKQTEWAAKLKSK